MNKKLIALAIATAFAAPVAMADSGNVKISGQLHVSLDAIKGNVGGTDNQTMSNVSSNASQVTFSGDEDLGNGSKAIWQVQTYITMGGTGNSDPTTPDGLGNGRSFLGLQSGLGTVLMGKYETPMFLQGRKVDLFGNQIGDSRNLTNPGGAAGIYSPTYAAWDLRTSNSLVYISPNMGGFQATGHYATNTQANNFPAGTTSNTTANTLAATSVAAAGLTYENGPAFAGLSYQRNNVAGAGLTEAPSAWRLVGGYAFGDLKLVGTYHRAKDNNGTSGNSITAATTSDDDRNVWGLGAAYKISSNTLKAQYYRASDFGSISNSGANMYALGLDHAMSKRTTVYVAIARTANDTGSAATSTNAAFAGSQFVSTGNGHGDTNQAAGSIAGQNVSAVSLGMIHNF